MFSVFTSRPASLVASIEVPGYLFVVFMVWFSPSEFNHLNKPAAHARLIHFQFLPIFLNLPNGVF
jgi:hypothetical protein